MTIRIELDGGSCWAASSPDDGTPRYASELERDVLAAWNATDQEFPTQPTVPQLVARQAARRLDALAVCAPDASLTYAELDRASNRLAHQLRARGVGRGAVVGLCVGRYSVLVTAALGILKAGAA